MSCLDTAARHRRRPPRVHLAALLLAGIAASIPAVAGDEPRAPLADADVVAIASRDWPSGAAGRLRVVVVAQGFEHVSTRVVAQWLLPSDDERAAWTVARSRTLVEPGMLALGVPRLEASGDALRVELAGAHVYAAGRDVACTFEVEADGRARALDPCGD